jgi:hypothetical protein
MVLQGKREGKIKWMAKELKQTQRLFLAPFCEIRSYFGFDSGLRCQCAHQKSPELNPSNRRHSSVELSI